MPGITDQSIYIKTLEKFMLPYAEEMSFKWFQQDKEGKGYPYMHNPSLTPSFVSPMEVKKMQLLEFLPCQKVSNIQTPRP